MCPTADRGRSVELSVTTAVFVLNVCTVSYDADRSVFTWFSVAIYVESFECPHEMVRCSAYSEYMQISRSLLQLLESRSWNQMTLSQLTCSTIRLLPGKAGRKAIMTECRRSISESAYPPNIRFIHHCLSGLHDLLITRAALSLRFWGPMETCPTLL